MAAWVLGVGLGGCLGQSSGGRRTTATQDTLAAEASVEGDGDEVADAEPNGGDEAGEIVSGVDGEIASEVDNEIASEVDDSAIDTDPVDTNPPDLETTTADSAPETVAETSDTTVDAEVTPTCTDGERACVGVVPQACINGHWLHAAACTGDTPWCLNGTCVACTPDDARCDPAAPAVQTCDAAGAWSAGESCAFGCTTDHCSGSCVPNDLQCNGNAPQHCDATGTWRSDSACTGSLPTCVAGHCVACAPDTHSCSGRTELACAAGAWQDVQLCPNVCLAGACTGECVPGAQRCSARTVETCDNAGQWKAAPLACTFGCADGRCVGDCVPDSQRCFGDTPSICSAVGKWEDGAACAQPIPDCDAGACGCRAGHTTCDALCVDLALDPKNCGACGHDCLGGACTQGVCQPVTLAFNQAYPVGLVVDADRVYWTVSANGALGAGQVKSIKRSGGPVTTLATGLTGPFALADDLANLYWTTGAAGNVQAVPKAGGVVSAVITELAQPFALTVDATYAYVSVYGANAIIRVPLAGGAPVTLAASQTNVLGITSDQVNVYWVNGAFGNPNSTVNYVAKDGASAPVVLADQQARPTAIAVDATNVYWTTWAGNGADAVRKCAKVGCNNQPTTLAGSLQLGGGTNYSCLGLDATFVYWGSQAQGLIQRVPIAGGARETIATGQAAPNCVRVDDRAIYWTTFTGGTVMMLAR